MNETHVQIAAILGPASDTANSDSQTCDSRPWNEYVLTINDENVEYILGLLYPLIDVYCAQSLLRKQ